MWRLQLIKEGAAKQLSSSIREEDEKHRQVTLAGGSLTSSLGSFTEFGNYMFSLAVWSQVRSLTLFQVFLLFQGFTKVSYFANFISIYDL